MQQFRLTEGQWCDIAGYPIALAYARDGKAVLFIGSEPDETPMFVKLAAENWRLKNLPGQVSCTEQADTA